MNAIDICSAEEDMHLTSMNAIKDDVDLLLFSLGTGEIFGINVLKVREITQNTFITRSPNLPEGVNGFASMRGAAIPVLNLSYFFSNHSHYAKDRQTLIVLDCCSLQFGFHVHEVLSISRLSVAQFLPWKKEKEREKSYIVSIVNTDQHMISIIDIESIISSCYPDVIPVFENDPNNRFVNYPPVIVVEDSSLCRRYIKDVLDHLGLSCKLAVGGAEGKDLLMSLLDRFDKEDAQSIKNFASLVILDQELPQISGYELARLIRADYRLSQLPIIVHTAISKSGATTRWQRMFQITHVVFKFDVHGLVEAIHNSID